MHVTQLLDIALPYSAADNRCGLQRKTKTERRLKLAALLNDIRNGKTVDLSTFEMMIDYSIFERKLTQWIEGLKKS